MVAELCVHPCALDYGCPLFITIRLTRQGMMESGLNASGGVFSTLKISCHPKQVISMAA